MQQPIKLPELFRVLMPDGRVVALERERYLRGVVATELAGEGVPLEAMKAQAVAARSYAAALHRHRAAGADVCTTTHCQGWGEVSSRVGDEAVAATRGEVLVYAGRVAAGFYHAHCDGRTRSAAQVWGVPVAWCQAVACRCGHAALGDHGVGMCQRGAIRMALDGADYHAILRHYYTGVELIVAP